MAVLISYIADFKSRKCIRAKEGHNIMIKGSILQEDTTILNLFVTNRKHQNP